MANSLKQQIYQQIAESQVKQAMRNNDPDYDAKTQLWEEYNRWSEMKALEAEYQAWSQNQNKKASGRSSKVSTPTITFPTIEERQAMKKQQEANIIKVDPDKTYKSMYGDAQKERALKKAAEDKERFAAEKAKKQAKQEELKQIGKNLEAVPKTSYMDLYTGQSLGANSPIPVLEKNIDLGVGSSIKQIPGLSNYAAQLKTTAADPQLEGLAKLKKEDPEKAAYYVEYMQQLNGKQPELSDFNNYVQRQKNLEQAKKWLDPNYKLQEDAFTSGHHLKGDELSRAKAMAKDELKRLEGKKYKDMTPEEQERYDTFKDLQTKTSNFKSFAIGAGNAVYKAGKSLWDLALQGGAQTSAAKMRDINAINAALGKNEEFSQEDIGEVLATPEQNRADIRQFENERGIPQLIQNAKTQNPIAYGGGQFAGNAAMYAATSPGVEALTAASGVVNPLGKFGINQLAQFGQDALLDYIPTLQDYMEDGVLSDEEKKALAVDFGIGTAANVLPGLPGLAKDFKAQNALKAADVGTLADGLKASDTVDDIVKSVNNQAQAIKGVDIDSAVKTQNLDPVEKALLDSDISSTHTAEQIADMQNYVKSTNNKIVDFANEVVNNPKAHHEPVELATDSPRAIDDIKKLTGIDTTGNKTIIDEKAIQHINNRHGLNGVADHSMADPNTLGRIEYIKNNYDEMYLGKNSKYRLKDGSFAPTVVYVKKIDGQYYAVEAVSDAKSKKNFITSAFIGDADSVERNIKKGSLTRAEDITNVTPSYTSKNEAGTATFFTEDSPVKQGTPSDFNVSDTAINVNKETLNNIIDKLKIETLNGKNGKKRYYIAYHDGDKVIPVEPGKVYDTVEEADNALKMNLQFFADQKKTPEQITEDLWNELKAGENQPEAAGYKQGPEVNEKGQKLSKLHETLQNTEMLTDAEKQAYADKNGFWYDPDNERELARQAQAAVENDLDGVYRQYAEGVDLSKLGGADAHKMFTASYDYAKMAQEALENGDEAAAKLYTQKSRNIMLNAREAATKSGQFNAAIAYYSKTPQGYVDKAYDLLGKQIKEFKTNNPKLADGIDDISEKLAKLLKDKDVEGILTGTDEQAKASLRKEVMNGLAQMVLDSKNKQLREALGSLSASDIDELIASKYADDIARQLDMFSMGSFGVKPETVDKVLEIFAEAEKYNINSKDYYKLEQEAFNLLANDLYNGKSLEDKINAWRYFSMLSSPQTHIRNNLGNLNNNVLTGIKNNIAAAIEAAADRISKATGGEGLNRTKTILNPLADNDLIKAAGEDFDTNAYRQYKQGGNKWLNATRELENAGHTYKDKGFGKVLNKLTETNSDLLDIEDVIAGKAKYQTSLAGFLKANGADASIFKATDQESKELLEQARQFALNQANEATFHQSNAFANWWAKNVKAAKESNNAALKGVGYALDTVMPFVKTPSNILAQSFAFSPLEFVKVVAETGKLKRGVISGADYINDIAKGITGSMGVAFGALLAHEGIIYVGTGDKDKDEYNDKRGIKSISFKVGDTYIPLAQLSPAATPIIAGAVVYQAMADKENALDAITSGAYSIAESITDMTMLSGVADTLSAVRYADSDTDVLSSMGRNIAGNLIGQMIPTLGGKIEKTIDPIKRTTYTDQKGKASKYWTQEAKYLSTKIPMLQKVGEKFETIPALEKVGDALTLEPSINSWGKETRQQDYGLGAGGRVINNFLDPLGVSFDTSNAVDNELRKLYDETHETSLLNYGLNASSNSTVDGNKLTEKEWTAFQKQFGSLKLELAESFMQADGYENMDSADKAEIYSQLGKFAKAYTYNQVTGKDLTSTNQKLVDTYESGGAKALIDSMTGKVAASQTGLNANSEAAKAISKEFESGNTEKANKMIDDAKSLSDYGLGAAGPQATYQKASTVIPELTTEQFATTYKKIDANGNYGITQAEIIDYLNSTNANQTTGKQIWNAYGSSKWKKIPVLGEDGWGTK